MIRSIDTKSVKEVLAPKALSARCLESSAARTVLEAFCLFSSVASTLGNVGQASYAAANACLDTLAPSHRLRGKLSSSLQIPAVSDAGMSASTFAKEQLEAFGALTLDEFASCLMMALAVGSAAVERTQVPLGRVLLASTMATSLLCDVKGSSERGVSGALRAEVTAMLDLAPSARSKHLESSVLRVMRELTGAPAASLTAETPLMEAGVDSLAATELSSRLRMLTGMVLSPTLVFEQPTPRAIASHLLKHVSPAALPSAAADICSAMVARRWRCVAWSGVLLTALTARRHAVACR